MGRRSPTKVVMKLTIQTNQEGKMVESGEGKVVKRMVTVLATLCQGEPDAKDRAVANAKCCKMELDHGKVTFQYHHFPRPFDTFCIMKVVYLRSKSQKHPSNCLELSSRYHTSRVPASQWTLRHPSHLHSLGTWCGNVPPAPPSHGSR